MGIRSIGVASLSAREMPPSRPHQNGTGGNQWIAVLTVILPWPGLRNQDGFNVNVCGDPRLASDVNTKAPRHEVHQELAEIQSKWVCRSPAPGWDGKLLDSGGTRELAHLRVCCYCRGVPPCGRSSSRSGRCHHHAFMPASTLGRSNACYDFFQNPCLPV